MNEERYFKVSTFEFEYFERFVRFMRQRIIKEFTLEVKTFRDDDFNPMLMDDSFGENADEFGTVILAKMNINFSEGMPMLMINEINRLNKKEFNLNPDEGGSGYFVPIKKDTPLMMFSLDSNGNIMVHNFLLPSYSMLDTISLPAALEIFFSWYIFVRDYNDANIYSWTNKNDLKKILKSSRQNWGNVEGYIETGVQYPVIK